MNKPTKKMIEDAALTHAECYAWEYIDEQFEDALSTHNKIESLCKNIQQLYNKRDQELGGNTHWSIRGEDLAKTVRLDR